MKDLDAAPIRYRAAVLPDGHLPAPPGPAIPPGQEVEVVVAPITRDADEDEGRAQREYLFRHWQGVGRGNGEPLAAEHDDYLDGIR